MSTPTDNPKSWSTGQMFVMLGIPFLLLFLLLNAAGVGQVYSSEQEVRLHKVTVLSVESQSSYQREMKAIGRVEAGSMANLGFESGGTLLNTLVDEGDIVTSGQLLAKLDVQKLTAQIQEVDATIARVEANARLAAISTKRITQLVADKLDSQQSLDEARETEVAAKAAVREALAAKARLDVEMIKSHLYAPFAGTIVSHPVDSGSVVAQGQTIYTMQQDNETEVRMALGMEQAFELQVGESYTLYSQYSQKPVQAVVKSVARTRNLNTRTIDVIFKIAQGQQDGGIERVMPGDLLSLSMMQEVPESGIWVPKTALTSGVRGLWTVYTVQPAEQNGSSTIVPKSVMVLYNTTTHAFVTGALQDGDQIVIQGAHRLVPGQLVDATLSESNRVAKLSSR